MSYDKFISDKLASAEPTGMKREDIRPLDCLFPFQRDLVVWSLTRGRAAIFAATGLGKTLMQLDWARHVSKSGPVLILTPLAVAKQTVREAARFGVSAEYSRGGDVAGITVANYEMLDRFDLSRLAGVVLDESSILKSYDGATRTELIQSLAHVPYRLACTATPSPNDHTELGNHSEFLGIKSRTEMLAEYFVHDGETTQEWRIKGHGVGAFWRWVSSWGAVVTRPSDLGYDDGDFELPPLNVREHVIRATHRDAWSSGLLFAGEATTLSEQRAVRRGTIKQRVEACADLARGSEPCIVWCELNDEADAISSVISGSVQVSGSDTPEQKEDALLGFTDGRYRVMVTKPSIAGFGMNWQHCSRMVFAGASHSFEQTYQAIRRCWRYGQRRPVDVFVVRSELDSNITENFKRKAEAAESMHTETRDHVRESVLRANGKSSREWNSYNPAQPMTLPKWINEENK